jgi:hypothetical protein
MYTYLNTALAVIASAVAARVAVAVDEPNHQRGTRAEPWAIRMLVALLIAVFCLANSPPSSANQTWQLYNCDRNFNLCQSKCKPEVKRPAGKEYFTLDGSKVPDCRRKCIDTQRKCQADAAKAPRTCTTTAQCAHPDEICSHGKCLKY